MKKELITHFIPKAPESEMFRNLRTNIQFMNTNKELRTLVITSTMPGEGKSYVTANLAVTFAQAGKKVVLVDSDMRKGRQFSIFDISPRPGISNYLSGVVEQDFRGDVDDIQNYIQDTDVENLKVITAGSVPPNPSELLMSPKMNKMMNDLKEICDIIIFDAPPALIVADAVILARQVDSCIIVTAHNQTKMDSVQKVKVAIENVGAKVAGVVINKIPASNKKYNQMYYYYGAMVSDGDSSKNQARIGFERCIKKIKASFEKAKGSRSKKYDGANRKHIQKKNNVIISNSSSSDIFDDIKYNIKK